LIAVVCKNSQDCVLTKFFADTLYCVVPVYSLNDLHQSVCSGRIKVVLFSESAFTSTSPHDLHNVIEEIKAYGVSQNRHIPVVAVLGRKAAFNSSYDLPVDDFIRTDLCDDALFYFLRRFAAVERLLADFRGKVDFSSALRTDPNEINIAAIDLDEFTERRLRSIGFMVSAYQLKERSFSIDKQNINCLVMNLGNLVENTKEYLDFLDNTPKCFSLLLISDKIDRHPNYLQTSSFCEEFYLGYSDLELRKRIQSLILHARVRSRLYKYLFDNVRLTLRDCLTDTYNRRFVDDCPAQLRASMERGACVCILDADHFKAFNDMYGHDVGDNLLRLLSAAIIESVRSSDLVCRYGGDEFILIMPNTALKDAHDILHRARENIFTKVFQIEDIKISGLSVSFGISYCSSDKDLRKAISNADMELSKNKKLSRKEAASSKQSVAV
jgi:diguanylate cyclase (GGDEF)-like protein